MSWVEKSIDILLNKKIINFKCKLKNVFFCKFFARKETKDCLIGNEKTVFQYFSVSFQMSINLKHNIFFFQSLKVFFMLMASVGLYI